MNRCTLTTVSIFRSTVSPSLTHVYPTLSAFTVSQDASAGMRITRLYPLQHFWASFAETQKCFPLLQYGIYFTLRMVDCASAFTRLATVPCVRAVRIVDCPDLSLCSHRVRLIISTRSCINLISPFKT